jgi:hypothetical protein
MTKVQNKKQATVEKTFEVSNDLRTIAEKVLLEQQLEITPSKVEYLLVYPNISKTVAGRCIKTGKELKFYSEKDYLIEMSGELWDALDDTVRYVLMQHELMHIHPVMNEKTGKWQFKVRDHDIKDFSKIINVHGTEWISKVKLSISSLYDLSPADEDNIKI